LALVRFLGAGSLRSRALALCFPLALVPRPRMSVAARETESLDRARVVGLRDFFAKSGLSPAGALIRPRGLFSFRVTGL